MTDPGSSQDVIPETQPKELSQPEASTASQTSSQKRKTTLKPALEHKVDWAQPLKSMLQACLGVANKLQTRPATYYLHDACTSRALLDFTDAAAHLAAEGVGFYITADVEHFAAVMAGLKNHPSSLAFWDFFCVHWYRLSIQHQQLTFFLQAGTAQTC